MNELFRELLALPEQGTELAREVDALHFVVISVTMLGAAAVGFFAIYFVVRWRRKGEHPTEIVKAPILVEAVWIGSLLAFFVAVWVVGYRLFVRFQVPPAGATDVYVTAKQFMWKFEHPSGRTDISVLTVPVGRPIRLNLTSRDVIHSFSVPAFRIKQDVLPGRYTTAWFQAERPGVYEILCAELCGVGHSNMRGRVVVLSAPDYEVWEGGGPVAGVRSGAGGLSGMASIGRELAARHACFGCHTLDGRTHLGPTWRGLWGAERRLTDGTSIRADAQYLTESMMDPRAKVVAGFGAVMPSYQGILGAPEVAALVELIKSLEKGDVVEGDLRAPPDPLDEPR